MTFRPFRNVIVCHMVPGSEDKVGPVFGKFDPTTRPQDLGVIGRILLSYEDLYIHVIERKEDPEISGQRRGLPAFQEIAEAIAPYVTPYPSYWQNPSHSVAKPFYQWLPEGDVSPDRELTVLVQRMKPGAEPDIARVFTESDAGGLPIETGVTGRLLFADGDGGLAEPRRVSAFGCSAYPIAGDLDALLQEAQLAGVADVVAALRLLAAARQRPRRRGEQHDQRPRPRHRSQLW